MPVRQRSPSSQGSAAAAAASATSFQTTANMPQDPNNYDASAYRTMRSRNPDGSSTVYRVHESVMRGGSMMGTAVGPTPTSTPHPTGPYYCGQGGPGGGFDSTSYATYAPSSYSPYYNCHIGAQQQQHHQPHMIFVQGNDGVDEEWEDEGPDGDGDDESRLVPYSSSSSSSSPATATATTPKRARPWCARNSTPCILSYMILAIAFVIGYVFLIEAFVDRSRASRSAAVVAVPSPSSASSPSGGLRGGSLDGAGGTTQPSSRPYVPPGAGAALAEQLDLDLEPQYYVLEKVIRPVGVGEVPSSFSSSSSPMPEVGSRSIVATENASPMGGSASLLTPDGGTIVRAGSDEPVRRKMYAGGVREKK